MQFGDAEKGEASKDESKVESDCAAGVTSGATAVTELCLSPSTSRKEQAPRDRTLGGDGNFIPQPLENRSNWCFLNSSLQSLASLGFTQPSVAFASELRFTRDLLECLAAGGPPGSHAKCVSREMVCELRGLSETLKAMFVDPNETQEEDFLRHQQQQGHYISFTYKVRQ